ncbi:MAG: hypothetical protein WCK86_06605 [Planctomycetia bacterium]
MATFSPMAPYRAFADQSGEPAAPSLPCRGGDQEQIPTGNFFGAKGSGKHYGEAAQTNDGFLTTGIA